MKMNKLTGVFLTLWFTFSALIAFPQEGLVSPACWLKADGIWQGDTVWRDMSGHGLHATPRSGAMPDTLARLNFNPCILLNDSEHFSVQLDTIQDNQADVIVVYETYDSTAENALWQLQVDSVKRVGQTTQRILNDNGQIVYDSTNRMKPVINYLAQSWRDNSCGYIRPCASTLDIGRADSLPLNGKFAEALYFDHRISDTAVIQWISYLAVKYGITLAQTDYLDSRKNVIWDYSGYPDYSTSIAGLGRDDSTGLFQKQTYFADGQIIMGIGSLANTNEGNPAIIADGDFLMFGCRDARPCVSTLYTQDGYTYEVIGRSMMQATGDVMTYNTFLWLDTNAVQDTVVPVLLIDRSGSGDFLAWEIDMVWPIINDSLGYYVYDNIYWDTDMNGRDAFCFAVRMPDEEAVPRMATVDDATEIISLQNERMAEGRGSRDARPCVSTEKTVQDTFGHNNEGHPTSTSTYYLFPNPNHGQFTVEIAYPVEQDVTVTVYASDGKKIMVMRGKGQSHYRFEGQMETSGHYVIDINSALERKQLKMVVN